MKIKSQIQISMVISLIIAFIISAFIITSYLNIQELQQQESLAADVVKGGYELTFLANDYIVNGEPRALLQWEARYASLRPVIEQLKPGNSEESRIISLIRDYYEDIAKVFHEIPDFKDVNSDSFQVSPIYKEIVWSRNNVQSQGLIYEAWYLRHAYNNDTNDAENWNRFLVFTFIAAILAIIIVNYLIISRRVVESIQEINAGSKIFATGNLDYRIKVSDEDEFGDLAEGLNRMAGQLKVVTASRDELNLEISLRKKSEEALLKSEVRFRTMADWSYDLEYWVDKDRKFIYITPSAEYITGYTAKEFTDDPKLIDRIVYPDDRELWESHVKLHIYAENREQLNEIEYRIIRRDGSVRWIAHVCRPIFDESLAFSGTRVSDRDITVRKNVEEALALASKKLNLLSSITRHDILNQLMVLLGYLEMALEDTADPKARKKIEKELMAAKTIRRQIEFTREYQELGVKAPLWQNVRACVLEAVSDLEMGKTGISVEDMGLEIYADPLCVMVFYNLAENALRYGGENMTKISVTEREENGSAVIVFADDGAGISDEDKLKLFKKGFGKNTGLGLFLSREILSITGITIIENGKPGSGARFEIKVPSGMYRFVSDGDSA